MKKYLVTYHSTPAAMEAWASATPEQKQAGMAPWMEWKDRIGNQLVEMGSPLMGGTTIATNGANAPSTKSITGYSIVQAADFAQAVSLFDNHPHNKNDHGMSVEVHEAMEM